MDSRVAVVVPCFNDGAYVEQAVASVREDEPVELVVVDDGSSDPATLSVLDELRARDIRVIRRENGGLAAARMTGVHATSAPYVLPLDSDDALEPGALGRLADVLDADASVAFVYGHLVFTGDKAGGRLAQPWSPFTLLYANRWGASCLFRREALLAAGGWSLGDIYEDWDLLMGLAEAGYAGAPVDQLVLHYRRHPSVRMNQTGHGRHAELYKLLRSRHEALFARRASLARLERVPRWRRLVYPLLLGARPLYPFRIYYAIENVRSREANRRRAAAAETRIRRTAEGPSMAPPRMDANSPSDSQP
ncbi:MAG TPA: glycosyltransferase family 2 protein [Gaiellaceae bacterium]|nr:glycosyltransferase family 2 protein [Gaiellaceae bacterium]